MSDHHYPQSPPQPEHPPAADPSGSRDAEHGRFLLLVRYVLPAVVVVGGLVVMSLGGESDLEGGAGIAGAGLAIFFISWLFRAGASGEREREAEEAARDYFDAHGRWPD